MNLYHKSLQINVTPLFDLSSKAGRLQRDWYMNEGRFFEEGGLPRGVAGQMIWPVVAAAGNAGIGALDVVRLVTEKNSICGAAAHRIIGLLAEMVELGFFKEDWQTGVTGPWENVTYRVANPSQIEFYHLHRQQPAGSVEAQMNQVLKSYELAKSMGQETAVRYPQLDLPSHLQARRKFRIS